MVETSTSDETMVQELYRFVEDFPFETYSPPDLQASSGAIDVHVHAGERRQDPLALTQYASVAGMRAIVLKNAKFGPTTEIARILNRAVAEWANEKNLIPTEVLGAVVCGSDTGGINPPYVERCIKDGARIVWLPSRDAANHLHRALRWEEQEAYHSGLSVMDGINLSTETEEVLNVVGEAGVALSFGHLNREEMLALGQRCNELGIDRRAFVDHPLSPVAGLTSDEMGSLARLGITLNFTSFELSPYMQGVTATDMIRIIKEAGVDNCTMSSDSCFDINPSSVESFRLHRAMLNLYGFGADAIATLFWENQSRLLGIDVYR